MRLIKNEKEIRDFLSVLRDRAAGGSPEIEQRVRAMLDDVKKHGDRAVRKYTETV